MLSRHTVSSPCMRLLLVLVFTSVGGGSLWQMLNLGYPLKPTSLKLRLSIRVPSQSMRLREEKQLEAANALDMCPMHYSALTALKVSVLNDLKAPKDYGLDERYNRISSRLRQLGANCPWWC